MTSTLALPQHLVPLAKELDDNKVTPGLLGFVIFAVIALALWALMKNMGKQMKKIDFEESPADKPPASGGASAPAQRTAGSAKNAEAPAATAPTTTLAKTPKTAATAKTAKTAATAKTAKTAKPAATGSAGSAKAAKPAGSAKPGASGKPTKSAKSAKPAAGPVKAPRPAPGK